MSYAMTLAHWLYLGGTLFIIGTMLFRKNVVVPAIVATFIVSLSYTSSVGIALQSTFRASLTAASSLFDIFLIIAVMTALLNALKDIGADEKMIQPFQGVMRNGTISFFVIVVVTYGISMFFWPTPAVPLVGAILIPVAVRAGLPPIGAGIAISLAGQGMALSSDYMIQIAPTLSAAASNLSVSAVADRALMLSIITGVVAIGLAYVSLRKHMQKPSSEHLKKWQGEDTDDKKEDKALSSVHKKKAKLFAVVVPVVFLIIVSYMIYSKVVDVVEIEGGEGAALIGGGALLLLITVAFTNNRKQALERVSSHIIDGLLFAFKAMGIVLPIAGFFFLGSDETAGAILGITEDAPGFLFELIVAGENFIPNHPIFAAFGILLVGMISGLDGSGFSGLPLTGALADPLSATMGIDATTLAAIGQMGAIWVGGGTLIAWSSLVAVAGFAKVPVMELVRKSFFPVVIGLLASTVFALLFL